VRQAIGERAAGSPRPTENEALRERQRDSVSADDDAQRRRRTPAIADQCAMKLQSATRWESWYTRKYCYYVVKRSIIINGSAINTRCTVLCAFKLVNHHPKRNSLEKRPNRRWRSRSRASVAGSRGGGEPVVFHGRLATRARRSPAVHGAAPSARSAGPSHPRPGPYVRPTSPVFTANSHRAHVRLTSDRSRACIRRARTRLTTAFTRHTTRGRRVPPTPNHRPSRPRPDASITVRLQLVRKAFA
jgi:hypothetical protein